jgi:hypothetical protein
MLEASKAAANVKPTKFNIDIALELINSNLKDSLSVDLFLLSISPSLGRLLLLIYRQSRII